MSNRKKPSKDSVESKLPRFANLTSAQYHADKTALGRSALWTFHERRRQYCAEYVSQTASAKVVTKAMDIGSLAHLGLLEPDKFPTQYAVFPDSVLDARGGETTNASKEFREKQEKKGLIVLKQKDFEIVKRMVESVRAKLEPEGWLDVEAKKEQAIYWIEPTTGMLCKCLVDWLIETPGTTFVLDFKTTGDASPSAFKYRIEDGGLWLQDAHYSEGAAAVTGKPVEFYFVVCETKETATTTIQALTDEDRQSAAESRRRLVSDLAQCLKTGNWAEPWENALTRHSLHRSCYA
jgi:exodeoxyribonuclease VIII